MKRAHARAWALSRSSCRNGLRRLPIATDVAAVLPAVAAVLAKILAIVMQIGAIMLDVAAILTQVAALGAHLRRVTRAPCLAQLPPVPRDVARIVTDVLSVLGDVAAIVTHVATIPPQFPAILDRIPLVCGERLHGRRAGLCRGLRPRRRREHNEREGHQS